MTADKLNEIKNAFLILAADKLNIGEDTPQETNNAQKTIQQHFGTSLIDPIQGLRGIELLQGSNGNLSPEIIKYRSAIQAQRDYYLNELAATCENVRDDLKTRRERKVQAVIHEVEQNLIIFNIQSLANAHMELQFGDFWINQPPEIKNTLTNKIYASLSSLIYKSIVPIDEQILMYAPIQMVATFQGLAKQSQTKINPPFAQPEPPSKNVPQNIKTGTQTTNQATVLSPNMPPPPASQQQPQANPQNNEVK